MKTVLHWKNIMKAVIFIFIAVFAINCFVMWADIPPDTSVLLNLLGGVISGCIASFKWEIWHFE